MILNSCYFDVGSGSMHVCERNFFFFSFYWCEIIHFVYFLSYPTSFMIGFIKEYFSLPLMVIQCFDEHCFWPDIGVPYGLQDLCPHSCGFYILCWEVSWNSDIFVFKYFLSFRSCSFQYSFCSVYLMLWLLFAWKCFLFYSNLFGIMQPSCTFKQYFL